MNDIELIQTERGRPYRYKSWQKRDKTAIIDRHWNVYIDGALWGEIKYIMRVRTWNERAWECPAWMVRPADEKIYREVISKSKAISDIVAASEKLVVQ